MHEELKWCRKVDRLAMQLFNLLGAEFSLGEDHDKWRSDLMDLAAKANDHAAWAQAEAFRFELAEEDIMVSLDQARRLMAVAKNLP